MHSKQAEKELIEYKGIKSKQCIRCALQETQHTPSSGPDSATVTPPQIN